MTLSISKIRNTECFAR